MKPFRHFALMIVLAVALHAQQAHAQVTEEQALDDLDLASLLNVQVSTASKTAESVAEAPSVITVVTYEDIVRWGYQSIAEVLQHTAGFYVLDDHILPNVGVRGVTGGLGAESSVIKVMIDGRSVAYRSTSGNWLGVELIPLESVQQIEIIRGPASALYGADAFLGVVNIITRSADTLRPVRARGLAGYTGAHPGGQFDVAGGAQWGDFDLMVGAAGEYKDRSGLKLPAQSPAPVLPSDVDPRQRSRDLTRRSWVLQSRLGYRVEDTGHLVLSAYASGLERGGDFAHWAQLSSGRGVDGSKRGTTIALAQYRMNLDGLIHVHESLELALQSTYFQGGGLPSDRIEIASDVFYVERKANYRGMDSMLEARFHPIPDFSAVVGTEVLFDHEVLPAPNRVNRLTGESVPVIDASERSDESVNLVNIGAYLSASYQAIEQWLKLTGGVRYDHHSRYGGVVSGRAGATSRWAALVVKLLYGSAFKAPSPYLLYAVPLRPGDVIGNLDLRPQFIHTLEGQISFRPNEIVKATTGLSHSWLLEKAEFTPRGINQTAQNVASQRSLAWESRIDVQYWDALTSYVGFDLVRSRRDLGQEGHAADLVGTENVVYPTWIARLGASLRIPSTPSFPLYVAVQGLVVGPRRAADTSIVERGSSFDLSPYALLNLSFSTRDLYLFRGHESRVALRVRNLLGARGPDPAFSGFEMPLAPREVFLELRHTY